MAGSPKKSTRVISDILPLAKELARVKKQAEALGLFTHDRELLECSGCDLEEDVTIDGRLMTCHRENSDRSDSGLQFERLNETTFRCPVCMTRLRATML